MTTAATTAMTTATARKARLVPTIGRIVIYREPGLPDQAAVVCHVHSETTVNLRVFADASGDLPHRTSIQQIGNAPDGGRSWDWPARA